MPEDLDQRPANPSQGLWAAGLLAGLQDAAYGLVLLSFMNKYLLVDLDAGAAAPGYVLAVFSAVVLLTNPVAGFLLDRARPRAILAGAVVTQGAAVALLLLAHSLGGFLAASALLAVGAGATWPLVYQIVAITQPVETRAEASATLAIVGYLSTGGGVAAGVVLASLTPWWVAIVVVGAMVVAPLGLLGWSCLSAKVAEAEPSLAAGAPAPSHSLRLLVLVVFVNYAAVSALAGTYGPYLEVSLRLSLLEAAPYLLPAGLAALGALIFAPRLSRPRRRPRDLAVLFVLAALGAAGLAAASTPLQGSVAAVPLAIGVAGGGPLVAATMLDVGVGANRGFIFGTLMSVEGVGAVLGPIAAATAVAISSPRAGILTVAVGFGVLVVLLFAIPAHRPAPRGDTR